MKLFRFSLLLSLIILTIEASAQLKAGTMIRKTEVAAVDSIEYYETDFATRQKSYMNLLVGTWAFTNMKKQSRIDADYLTGVSLTLNNDSTFTGCGKTI